MQSNNDNLQNISLDTCIDFVRAKENSGVSCVVLTHDQLGAIKRHLLDYQTLKSKVKTDSAPEALSLNTKPRLVAARAAKQTITPELMALLNLLKSN